MSTKKTPELGLKPVGNKLIVRRDESEKMIGNIHLPDKVQDKEKPRLGTVLAVGPQVNPPKVGLDLPADEIVAGDRVIFNNYAGQDLVHNDETLLICVPDDILAIVVKE